MRRHSFRWTLHRALLGLCVLLQSSSSLTAETTSSTNVPNSTLNDSAGQTSSEISSTNSPATTQENLKPGVVPNLIVSDRSTSSVSLTWNSQQGINSSYTVEWPGVNGSNKVNVSYPSYTVTNLTAGVNYTFSVTAVAADGVTAGAPTRISAFTKPDVATNLTISDRNTTSVSLTWNSPQGSSSSYIVEWTNGNMSINTSIINTSYTVTNLTAGVNYTFSVTAVAADGVTAGAPTQVSAFTKPDVVNSLNVSGKDTSFVTLTWNSPQGNSSFFSVGWIDGNVSKQVNTSSMSYTVTNLTAGVNYTFSVTAVAADGVTAGAPTRISAFTKPGVITNLTVSDRSTSSVSLTWNSQQGINSSYTVEWPGVNGSNKVKVSYPPYTVTNLTAGVNYTFSVTAVAADGVTAGAPTRISAFTKPGVITNLIVSDRSTSSVSLTWNSQQGINSSYTVEWPGVNGSNKVNVSYPSYTVTNLTAGVNYTFSVTAVAADGVTAGAPTQISAFTKPDVATNLTISDRNTTSVSLTWNSPQGSSSSYIVEWTNGNMSINTSIINTSYTVTNLTAGVNYTFSVTAVAADGVTAGAAAQVSAFTKPGVITNLTVSDRSTSSVSLTWNSQQGINSSYTVEWPGVNGSNKVKVSYPSYTVTNLTAGVNYTFSVTAVAADGVTAGAPTRISAFTKPDVVNSLNVSGKDTSFVTLTWNSPQGNSSFFSVGWIDGNVSKQVNTSSMSYTVTNLTAGVNYTFSVTAVAADGVTAGAPTRISAFTKPGVITNLIVSDRSTSSVSLTWNSQQGINSSYTVEWPGVNGSNKVNVSYPSYTVTNLTAGVNYTFSVTAVAADGVTAGAPTQISAFTKPDVATNLTISDRNTTSVSLTWNSPQGSSSSYIVEWTNGNMSINTSIINTSYTVTNLTAGVNYTFSVTAVAADGVTAGAPTQVSAFTKPHIVQNLTVIGVTTSSVLLSWIKPVGESSYYRVQYDSLNKTLNQTTQNTMINISDLTPGVQYMFRVFAVAADNSTEGSYGYISTYTKPEVIRNLTVTEITTTSLFISWTEPIGQRFFFRVQWTKDYVTSNATISQTFFNITNLIAGVNYNLSVSAVAGDNSTEGKSFGLFSVYTKPDTVQNLIVVNVTTSSVLLSWIKPVGESSYYRVQYDSLDKTLNQTTQNTMINISDLTPGVQYMFRVFAVSADNSTEGSYGYISTYTKPEVIRNLTVTEITTTSLFISWTEPIGQRFFFRVQWTNDNVTSNATTSRNFFNITDLMAGVNYYIKVSAVAADNSSEGNLIRISSYTKPHIVQNLTVIGVTTSSVLLSWIKPVGESSYYRVQYDSLNKTLNQTTQNTMINISDLTPGVQYMFRVFAVAADNSTEGSYGYISTYTKPEVIRNLTVTEITTTSLFISWTEPIGQRFFFRVQWTKDYVTSNATISQTFFNITNLIAGVNYNLSVSAVAGDNSTEGKSFGLFSVYTKPDTVQNLIVINVTTSSVLLSWIKPVGESSYYRVQYDSLNKTLNQTTQNTMINISDLTPGVQYMFRVFAVAADNSTEGTYGYISTYTKPEVIRNLTVSEITTTSLFISWTEPIGQRFFFRVQWTKDYVTSNATISQTFFNITNLIAGVNYNLSVSAVAGDNSTEGKSFGIFSIYTKPDTVQNLIVINVTTSSVLLSWIKPVGESSYYRVQYDSLNKTLNQTTQNTMINISDLTPGVQYMFRVFAVAADNSTEGSYGYISTYTKPEVIRNLTVTEITTTSLFISWTEPIGQRFFFKVQWTNDNVTSNATTSRNFFNITDLMAGVNYYIIVSAVAADNSSEGNLSRISSYTKPHIVQNLTVIGVTTSSVLLSWIKPVGESSYYRVQYDSLNKTLNQTTQNTMINISDLTPGVQYMFRVFAVSADNSTEGSYGYISTYTKPEVIRNLTVTEITTTSLFISWTEPIGQRFFFRVQWTKDYVTSNATISQTFFNITNLIAGVNYNLSVSAVAGDNSTEGKSFGLFSVYTKPDTVQNLIVVNVTTSSVLLSWIKPVGESSYYRVQCDSLNKTLNQTTQNTMINISDLTPGVQYMFRVFAVAADNSTEGSYGYISTYTKPEVIMNLTVTEITTTSLFINWTEPVGQRSFFKVQWTNDNVTSNATTSRNFFNITDLMAGVNYYIKVSAVAADNSSEGNLIRISSYTKPDTVQNLTVVNVTTSSVLLSWIKPVGASSYYRVQYDSLNKTLNQTTQNPMINISDLTPGVQYMFRVFAVAADNSTEGSYGYIATYTKPEVIRNLTVTEITTTSLFISWTEPIGQRFFFRVQWTKNYVTSNATISQTFFNITNLIAGVNYNLSVSAVAGDNSTEGKSFGLFSVYTKPDTVQNLIVINVTTSSVLLSWIKPVGESSYYRVQYDSLNKTLNQTTQNTMINISDLTPGVQYMFRVFAVAADNSTEGSFGYISIYTKPHIVQNLTVIGVTTSSVLLSWIKPVGESSYYRVQYDSLNKTLNQTTQNTMINISDLTPGVQYMFRVFAVSADNSTEGSYGYISTYTKPEVIRNQTVTEITTTSLFINWTEPVGQRSFFKVQWTNDNVTSNAATRQNFFNITDLMAGVNYYIIVSAVAADNSSEGNLSRISSYTKPHIVQNLTVTGVTTSSVLLSWIKPVGESSYYRVQCDSLNKTLNQTTQNTMINISDLTPGVQYMFRVFAVAADNSTEGSYGYIATYTKPEVIRNLTVTEITTTSLLISWTEPIGQRSFFKVQWTNYNVTSNTTTSQTFFNITNLIPGGYYYIRVSAVAADNKTEGEVITCSPYTIPEIIRNLTAFQISTTNVSLNWTAPTGKSAFFRVLWQYGSVIFNKTTKLTSSDITDLTPGVSYTFKVSAIADDNFTEGGIASLSTCTDASPVFTYKCEGPNRTDALLNIKWKKPNGSNQGFNLSSGTYISKTITCDLECNHTISNLQYGIPYNVTITTVGCGQSGTLSFVCTTGFTDPPVRTNPADLGIKLSSDQKGTFVQFGDSLLNSTNGDITAYGVLLSTNFNSNSSAADLKYTYDDWKQKTSQTYLTVLKLNAKRVTRSETIQIEIGTNEFANGTNYKNAPLVPNQYRVAVVVFTYLYISDGIVDTSLSFFSITPFAPDTINIYNPLNTVGIVLGVLFFIIIILIIVIIVFIKLKRQRKKNDTDIPIPTVRTKISIPVKVLDYEGYFKKQQADSNCGFAEEYEDLKVVGTAQSKVNALALENKGKNRYNNVLPYDSSRVKLSTHGSPFDDYINANYIAGYNSKKEYIAAQGPLPATVNEFWRMIWEKHVQTIVMLTKCNEQGRVKCEKYWPSETKMYSNITVTNMSEITLEDWTISDFTIRNVKTAESREVRHFHFTAWPDHGVPETTEVLINFRHLVREHMDQYSRHSPTVVHCSAGVGRTGTFIALDHLIFQIERESMVDIFGIVYDMRMHRPLMVQTEDQYVFLNHSAVDIIKSRMGTNVDLIYQNAAAFSVYGNVDRQWQ
ncbi:receptor-type tyrosine-protein phosphatase beta-like isoform X3 [Pygocentrus nattereri]|uniref:receptor-type tyrosine-protein phosphatase beta-like isoform X3 n=1 Tax=Pygocentrus nattereri TaxID=42514 RepID=UPI0018918AFC|nr:receptor-type tyrosine-protein phosphatase beta-like isoform X3 [Pygocentrus nattereri]